MGTSIWNYFKRENEIYIKSWRNNYFSWKRVSRNLRSWKVKPRTPEKLRPLIQSLHDLQFKIVQRFKSQNIVRPLFTSFPWELALVFSCRRKWGDGKIWLHFFFLLRNEIIHLRNFSENECVAWINVWKGYPRYLLIFVKCLAMEVSFLRYQIFLRF